MTSDFGQQQFQRPQFGHDPAETAKTMNRDTIRQRLSTPSRGLVITGLLSVVLCIGGLVGGIIFSAVNRDQIEAYWVQQLFGPDAETETSRYDSKRAKELKEKRLKQAKTAFTLVLGMISIGCLILAAYYMFFVSAGLLMKQQRNYQFCRWACLLATLPILSPLLVAGIPFGVLGLRQLANSDIKKSFDA